MIRSSIEAFSSTYGKVIALWLGWWVLINLFQAMVFMRFTPMRPDHAYNWTASYTQTEPASGSFFQLHSRWDSGFYVDIAREGYEGVNVAFSPVYPITMRLLDETLLRFLLQGMAVNRRLEIAGFVVSSAASLVAALGLFALLRSMLEPEETWRGLFYFLIYPGAFFLTQIYTEALFIALIVWVFVCLNRRWWWMAGSLAAVATLTRPVGVLLVFSLGLAWLLDWYQQRRPAWHTLVAIALPLPVLALYNRWLTINGFNYGQAQAFFGRMLLRRDGLEVLQSELTYITDNPQAAVHVTLDLFFLALAMSACLYILRKWPLIAIFGMACLLLPLLTFRVVGMGRYSLTVIPVYMMLAQAGRSPAFDRVWTIASVLIMALYMFLFVHGFWVG